MIRFAKKSNYTNTNNSNNNVPSMKTEIDVRKSRKIPASDMSNHEFNDVNWVPMSRNQKTRKPINPTSNYLIFYKFYNWTIGYVVVGLHLFMNFVNFHSINRLKLEIRVDFYPLLSENIFLLDFVKFFANF